MTVHVRIIPSTDPRLGAHIVHDDASRGYALMPPSAIDKSTWRSKSIRIYDPVPNPNQTIGNCTGVAKMIQFNATGNRISGVTLNMADADKTYSVATEVDDFTGSWPPDDTGSSGLGAAKASVQLGTGGTYSWLFGGADEVVQAIMNNHVVNLGTEWDNNMFNIDSHGVIHPGGGLAGGHEWSARRYDATRDLIGGRCWWGGFRDFFISRADVQSLLVERQGDAHVQTRGSVHRP